MKIRIFDEVVELAVEQWQQEQNQHGEQPVTQLGDGDQGMLPNEEGNKQCALVSLVAGIYHSGHTICILQGPEISKFSQVI